MSLGVNTNLVAMNTARHIGRSYGRLAQTTEHLASGLRINKAADDAAGMAIRELMRADIAVLNQGVRNAADAISMIQTAEGAMSVIDEKLIRMKELAEQAATGTYTTAQRQIMNSEYQAMAKEIDRIAEATEFNGVKLLDGSVGFGHEGSGMKVHFGSGNSSAEDYYHVRIDDMRATKSSGLQVGNGDLRDTLRTTALDAADPGDTLAGTGSIGLRFSDDGQSTWQKYGFVTVDSSNDSINDLVHEINQGAAASGTLAFGAVSNATVMAGQSMTINGQVFSFSTTTASSYDEAAGTGVINLTTAGNASSIAFEVAAYVNSHASSIGVFASPLADTSVGGIEAGGATVTLTAYNFGEQGNAINTAFGATVFAASQTELSGGGEKVMTASVYYNSDDEVYELQIQMDQGGDDNQVQIFSLYEGGATLGGIVAGGVSGTTLGSSGGNILPTNAAGAQTINNYASMDEADEWSEPQNGAGDTDWNGADILTQSAAQSALGGLDGAIAKKDSSRASLGALQNRLENTITNLQIQTENLSAAESHFSDVDVAMEMTRFTYQQVVTQAGAAMMGQANSSAMLALSLINV